MQYKPGRFFNDYTSNCGNLHFPSLNSKKLVLETGAPFKIKWRPGVGLFLTLGYQLVLLCFFAWKEYN